MLGEEQDSKTNRTKTHEQNNTCIRPVIKDYILYINKTYKKRSPISGLNSLQKERQET